MPKEKKNLETLTEQTGGGGGRKVKGGASKGGGVFYSFSGLKGGEKKKKSFSQVEKGMLRPGSASLGLEGCQSKKRGANLVGKIPKVTYPEPNRGDRVK